MDEGSPDAFDSSASRSEPTLNPIGIGKACKCLAAGCHVAFISPHVTLPNVVKRGAKPPACDGNSLFLPLTPPKQVSCDQCGRVCKVIAASWNDDTKQPAFNCLIKCEECGQRTVTVKAESGGR